MLSRIVTPKRLLGLSVIWLFILHASHLNMPPNGYHQWRESDTAAMILNYVQEDGNFLQPRVNQRGSTVGITGSELPIYQYSAALLYSVFGTSHVWARLLTLLGAALALLATYHIVVRLTKNDMLAALTAWCTACSPLFAFYTYKIMPDIWAVSLSILSFLLFLRSDHSPKNWNWWVAILALACASAIKPTALAIGLPVLLHAWSTANEGGRVIRALTSAIGTMIATALAYCWYMHAQAVNDQYHSGGFYLGGSVLKRFYEVALTGEFPKMLLLRYPPELWIGWSLVLVWVTGVILSRSLTNKLIFWGWVIGCYLVFIPTAHHTTTHDYYNLPAVFPFAVFTAWGLWWLMRKNRSLRILAVLFIIAAPIVTWSRISHRITEIEEFEPMRQDADLNIGREEKVMVEETTTAIRLYQMNRWGWPLRSRVRLDVIRACLDSGAMYLVLDSPLVHYDPSLTGLFDTNSFSVGPLYGYKVLK